MTVTIDTAKCERVLVVDDEPKTLSISSDILGMDGYRVATARDGRAALEMFEADGFDAVVTDIRMPGIGGIDLLEKIRAIDPDVPVIIITGYATLETATKAVARGAFEYLFKPIDFDRLRSTLRRALERHRLTKENRRLVRELAAANARLAMTNTALQQEVALERDLLSQIHGAVPAALAVFDGDARLVHENEASRRLGAVGARLRAEIEDVLRAAARTGEAGIEGRIMAFGERVLKVSILALAGTRALLVAEDLTEAVRLEDELVQAEKLSSLGTLAGGVVHDLSSPLSAVLGTAQLLQQDLCGAHESEIQAIIQAARYMREVCLGLTEYARRSRPEESRAVDVSELCEKALAIARYAKKLVDVEIVRRLEPGVPAVRANPNEVLQVLVNLIVNAADAAPRGRVEVETRRGPGRTVAIVIRDDGPGIAEPLHQRIFEPFYTTKGPGQGTGLGLYIARRIVQRLGGEIRLESATGAGATFTVELPAV